MIQRDWTALETLAEVSRQIEANEKQPHEDRGPSHAVNGGVQPAVPGAASAVPLTDEHFELHEQFTHENPPANPECQLQKDVKGNYSFNFGGEHDMFMHEAMQLTAPTADENGVSETANKDALPVENLTALIQSATDSESANLSMAAAATARLNPDLLDAQPAPGEGVSPGDGIIAQSLQQQLNGNSIPIPADNTAQPWGEITYVADPFEPPNIGEAIARSAAELTKGGFRLDAGNGPNGVKSRHSRARFDATRRKEVQEVRKIGACIRCRVLRKTCSKGQPCDTCRKVLSPRVWRSGCVRTKFSEQLDLYSAGVQIVLAQTRVNNFKAQIPLFNHGTKIAASHFPDKDILLSLYVLERDLQPDGNLEPELDQKNGSAGHSIVMVDNDSQDVPGHLEAYMREVLPEFCRLEPSHFMRVTLEIALRVAKDTNDNLLKKAIELWGLVELLDRERQWSLCITSAGDQQQWIKDDAQGEQQEIFTTICLQLTAAAERKAGNISRSLLTGMQRVLQDSKTKVEFSMYFATLILLNSVEKSTWSFKAWEQDSLRPLWPLTKEPNAFSQQGYVIADLLRMLLTIRRVLPRTACREEDGILITHEEDPVIKEYFETLNLKCEFFIQDRHPCSFADNLAVADVQAKQESPVFSPTDPRSFELLFCSTLLLPGRD
jgi:hypothetical protein